MRGNWCKRSDQEYKAEMVLSVSGIGVLNLPFRGVGVQGVQFSPAQSFAFDNRLCSAGERPSRRRGVCRPWLSCPHGHNAAVVCQALLQPGAQISGPAILGSSQQRRPPRPSHHGPWALRPAACHSNSWHSMVWNQSTQTHLGSSLWQGSEQLLRFDKGLRPLPLPAISRVITPLAGV